MSTIAGVIGGFLKGIAEEILKGLVENAIEGLGNVMRIEVASVMDFIKSSTASTFQSMLSADPHSSVGVSTSGLIYIMEQFLKATAWISTVLPAEIIEELFLELLQEGFSNAVQTSIGGAFQTILNVWRGGMPPNPDECENIVTIIDAVDVDTACLLIAMSGNNIPTTFFRAIRGWRQFVDDQTRTLRTQLLDLLNKWNTIMSYLHDLAFSLSNEELSHSLLTIREAYQKAFSIIDMVGERALSRLQELLTECRTAKEWLNMGTIDSATAEIVAEENKAEADMTYQTYCSIRDTVLDTLATVDVQLGNLINKIEDLINRLLTHINNIINATQLDFSEDYNKLLEALKKVIAYRHAIQNKTELKYPVELTGTPVTQVTPGTAEFTTTTYTIELTVEYTTE